MKGIKNRQNTLLGRKQVGQFFKQKPNVVPSQNKKDVFRKPDKPDFHVPLGKKREGESDE